MFSIFTHVMKPVRDTNSDDIEDPEESTRTRRTNKQNGDYYGDDFFEEDN